jgi:hypothetical protein
MQEIAFSIPESAMGLGYVSVKVNGISSNTLPFTVRTGNIYHVMSNGDDTNGDGSFSNPWKSIAMADSIATGGDTLYIHNVQTGKVFGPDWNATSKAIYNNKGFKSNESNQFAYIAYPGIRPTVIGGEGVHVYQTTGIVTSKLDVYASNADGNATKKFQQSSLGIQPSDWGRVITNIKILFGIITFGIIQRVR